MAEFEEKAKQPCAEVKAGSYITSQPRVEKELGTKKNEEQQKNSRDVQQVMSLTIQEGNQGHSEGEHRECFKDPGMKNEKTDEQDKDTGVKRMEKINEQEEKTIEREAKACQLKENAVKEGEVTVDRDASHGEKNDKQEEKDIKADGKIAEPETEKRHVEERNQGHSESEKHREGFKEPCLKKEEREEQDEDKMEQSREQGENTREKKSELTENSLEEGARNIDVLKKNASQDEKNDEAEERNIKIDGKIAEGEKEKSQGDEEETREPRQQRSEVVNNGVEEGEMNVEPEKKETSQDKDDGEQAEKAEAVERSAETSKVKNKRFFEKQPFKKAKYFTIQTGNTRDSHKKFLKCLHEKQSSLKQGDKAEKCKFILVFCPVVFRAGTDIEVALHQLNEISDTKPAALVVLHCTNDPECVVPVSSRAVTRKNMITVDCLFHEDNGFYKCSKNKEAVHEVIQWLKTKPWRNEKCKTLEATLQKNLQNVPIANKTGMTH